MKARLRLRTSRIAPNIKRKTKGLDRIPKLAHDKFVSETPIDTGNARRRTRLQGTTIKANYDYAVPLDQGSSKQARQGMSRPTIKFIKAEIARILGR